MRGMRSRFLVGASGWLLGADAATCGSMLAVDHLAHGLLGPGSQQLSPADVRADLASSQAGPTAPSPSARPAMRPARPARAAAATPAASRAGTLLFSKGGSAMAVCEAGRAYLQYWSPAPGYQVDDVVRGPAVRVRVELEGTGTSLVMTISCASGQPVDRVSSGGWADDGHHDD
jgi:hypothetical protein